MKVIDISLIYLGGFREPYIETADGGQLLNFSNIETYRKNMACQSKIFWQVK
jgi:hypothetical protein